MRIRVHGDSVSDSVVKLYVDEIVKAHPQEKISEVDIFVENDYMKVILTRDKLMKIA